VFSYFSSFDVLLDNRSQSARKAERFSAFRLGDSLLSPMASDAVTLFTFVILFQYRLFASAKRIMQKQNNSLSKIVMGDKSPKSVQKKSNQKDSKTASANKKKQQATAAKQTPAKGR
jgi:hypothetical protein